MRPSVAVGVGGDDHERVRSVAGSSALEGELGDPPAGVADRQRVGQHGPPGALGGVEQVGRLDEHQRVAAGRVAEAPAHVGARHAGVDEQLRRRPRRAARRARSTRAEVGVAVGLAAAGGEHRQALDARAWSAT